MSEREDTDQLDNHQPASRPRAAAPGFSSLPDDEPQVQPLAERRSDLVHQIQELEGALEYMGSGHPRRNELRQRLLGLQALLKRWDQAASLQADHGP